MRSTSGGSCVAPSTRTLRSVIWCDSVVTTLMAEAGERRRPARTVAYRWCMPSPQWSRSCKYGGPPPPPRSPAPASTLMAALPTAGRKTRGSWPSPKGPLVDCCRKGIESRRL